MHKLRIGVLRGGPSSEYEVSLKTGQSILGNLPEKYAPMDLLVSKDGEWHRNGISMNPSRALQGLDAVVNAMHGEYGEDGQVQRLLDSVNIPYTGSGTLASAIAMNKALAKDHYKKHKLRIARHLVLKAADASAERFRDIFRTFPHPSVVKPVGAGSSVGVTIARSYHDLEEGAAKAFAISPTILIEEFIPGREATCGVIDNFRNKEVYSLFPIEIIKPSHKDFFDYEAKYGGESQEICPGNFTQAVKDEIQQMAILAHKALGLRHYSRSDFIVSPRGIYILETNTLPGMTTESLFPKSLAAVGSSLPEFLDHLITLARERK